VRIARQSAPALTETSSNIVSVAEIRSWASQLTSESRKLDWIIHGYVWPDAVARIFRELKSMSGGVIGLIGL